MKIINQAETAAIIVGLRLLQRYGYPKEHENGGELDIAQIDELCEAINCDTFANLPVVQDTITVYAVVSDTDEGTRADLYIDKEKAQSGYIQMVCSYDQAREELDGNDNPTYEEAKEAWGEVVSDSTFIIDTISFEEEEFEILTPITPPVQPDPAPEMRYLNHYRCECGQEWNDQWDSMCNDRCPECGKEIEPYHSDEL